MAKAALNELSAGQALSLAFDKVNQAISVTGGGSSTTDGGTFTPSIDNGTPIEGVRQDTVSQVADQKYGVARISPNRALKIDQDTLLSGEDLTNLVMGTLPKPTASATYSPSNYKDKGTVTKAVVKGSAGSVFSVRVTNINAAVRYFQLHNKASAPAGADTASRYFMIPAGTATAPGVLLLTMDFFAPSWNMNVGISWAISTTADTFTDSATAGEHSYDISYV